MTLATIAFRNLHRDPRIAARGCFQVPQSEPAMPVFPGFPVRLAGAGPAGKGRPRHRRPGHRHRLRCEELKGT
ncbi:MAG: hypothetical protein EA406_06365 [Rhodospirillales bacterium]|nr:MAG: hypothetical protein EA406_06365 [Rhodospirillales bacterium]